MASVMSLKDLNNKVSRNGFDLSRKNCFTAKAGELLPVMLEEVLPGDKFKINTQWFTRTQPVNTAAYTRVREYYDFYFVPTRLLWRDFPQFITQMPNQQHAISVNNNGVNPSNRHPYFTSRDVGLLLEYYRTNKLTNFFNLSRSELSCKLLSYLGYTGIFYDSGDAANEFGGTFGPNFSLNPFPLLAYQKIYSDYFRNQQWERSASSTFNVDYLSAFNALSLHIDTSQLYSTAANAKSYNMFDMRYCDWNKDYFMGLMPNSQFGSDAVASPLTGFVESANNEKNIIDFDDTPVNGVNAFSKLSFNFGANTDAGLSVIALRKAEALQRWKEISQSGDYDYKTQLQKHWNVNVSDVLSEKCRYLGGSSANLDISEVVNTNLTGDAQSDIAGKGVGSGNGFIDFDAQEHGYIMCIYHCVPLLDYASTNMQKPLMTKTDVTDYAIPEMDKIGMVSVPFSQLVAYNPFSSDQMNADQFKSLQSKSLGYAPRYVEYKTSIDEVHGAFVKDLVSWVAPMSTDYIYNYFYDRYGTNTDSVGAIAYDFFKVNPSILDTIFAVNSDSTVSTDQFLINSYFDIKAVRNLDYNGLPY